MSVRGKAAPAKAGAKGSGRTSGRKPLQGEVLPPIEPPVPAKVKPKSKAPTRKSSHRVGRGGDGEHVPTDQTRRVVEAMASYGIPQDAIAALVSDTGISEPTLRKHYRRELDTARGKLAAKLMESLVAQALGHPAVFDDQGRKVRDEQRRYAPAAMFLLKREDYQREQDILAEGRAQEAAQRALRDRLKIVFEYCDPDELEVIGRAFNRVRDRLAVAPAAD